MHTLHFFKDALGWMAMVAFSASYLCKSALALRRAQAGAAAIWTMYGLATGAMPVVVSNVVVVFMAVIYPAIKRRWDAPTGAAEPSVPRAADSSESELRQHVPTGQPFGR